MLSDSEFEALVRSVPRQKGTQFDSSVPFIVGDVEYFTNGAVCVALHPPLDDDPPIGTGKPHPDPHHFLPRLDDVRFHPFAWRHPKRDVCPQCGGVGFVDGLGLCTMCEGSGQIFKHKTIVFDRHHHYDLRRFAFVMRFDPYEVTRVEHQGRQMFAARFVRAGGWGLVVLVGVIPEQGQVDG